MSPDDAKTTLLTRRAELLGNLDRIEHHLDQARTKDWEDAAIEAEDDEMLQSLGQAEQAEIRRIEAALGRIDAGTYGACVRCGTPVAEARLAAVPETPFCARCAAA